MKNKIADRGVGFWISIAAGIISLLGSILYLVLDGADKTFTPLGFGLALGGAVATVLVLTRFRIAPLISSVLYAAAFGVTLRVALPSLSDVWNKVNFIGGNATSGMTFSAVYLLCGLLSCVACFMGQTKSE